MSLVEAAIDEIVTNLDENKAWFIKAFGNIKDAFLHSFDKTEKDNHTDGGINYRAFYPDLQKEVDAMHQFLYQYKEALEDYDPEVAETFNTVLFMADDGWNMNSQKVKNKYSSRYYGKWAVIVKDFNDWYSQINVRIIIFDGTASIHPYYNENCFSVIEYLRV